MVPGALGSDPDPDRLLRAARGAPAAGHGHDHRARGLPPRGGEGRRALRAAVLGRLLAAAPARAGDRRRHDHAAGEHAQRGALRRRALAHPPRLEQARVRQRPRVQHEGARPAAAPHQVRDGRVRRALQALRRALHRAAGGPAREPARGDAGLARLRARDLAGDGAQPGAGEHGPGGRGPRAGAAVAAGRVHQEGRRARRRVRRLPVLRVPDGPRRVLAHRRHRQPDAGDAGEGRAGARALRRPPRQGDRPVPAAAGHRSPSGRSRTASDAVPPVIRRAQILEQIQRDGGVSIAELARAHGVSPVTVHRDLEQLAREGLVERVHGGARTLRGRGRAAAARDGVDPAGQPGRAARRRRSPRTRPRLVANGSTIFLDASSSALALARRLAEHPPNELTLVTNSPAIVHEITSEPIHVVACPGELDQHMRMLAGPLDRRVPRAAQLRRRVHLGRRGDARRRADDLAAAARRRADRGDGERRADASA